jgi:hypothetical protein
MSEKIYAVRDATDSMWVPVLQHKINGICQYTILRDALPLRNATLSAMIHDLQECIDAIVYLQSTIGDTSNPLLVRSSVLFAAIFKYARCFTENGGGTQLNESAVFKGPNAKHLEWHTETMEIRNKYLAHRTGRKFEEFGIVLYLDPDLKNKRFIKDEYVCVKMEDDEIKNYTKYNDLFATVLENVKDMKAKMLPAYQKYIADLDVETTYNISELPDTNAVREFQGQNLNNNRSL